jgi:uncharacterized protein (DUF488 family)
MYYRRKILMAIMQIVGGTIEKIALQKLLLLLTKNQDNPIYDFIPSKYGGYSFSSNADLTVMVKKGMLSEEKTTFSKMDGIDYVSQLTVSDSGLLRDIVAEYGKMTTEELMYTTYIQYPYYAIRSERAKDILSESEFRVVQSNIYRSDKTILFTIGYEGISLEEYLNRLITNDIKLLVDVRKNPLSMKFGFSKSQLIKYCSAIGVSYIHLPEVGIKSEFRQELNTQSDYDKLFTFYRNDCIPKTKAAQEQIVDLLNRHQRIALTCFESNINQCHRKHLAEAIAQFPCFSYELTHI